MPARPRENIVRVGLGAPYGLSVAYERRLGSHVGLGAEMGSALITGDIHGYGRIYALEGPVAPFASARAGVSVAGLMSTLWYGPMTGLDAGVQVRSASGFVFEGKLGADVVWDQFGADDIDVAPRLGDVATLVPQVSLSVGWSF